MSLIVKTRMSASRRKARSAGSSERMPTSATRDGSSAGSVSRSCANHSGARPSAAASGIPCTLPDGLVSGVLRSPWASIQITPPGCPAAAARPASVPIAIEWSPPSTSGRAPSRTVSSTSAASSAQASRISGR